MSSPSPNRGPPSPNPSPKTKAVHIPTKVPIWNGANNKILWATTLQPPPHPITQTVHFLYQLELLIIIGTGVDNKIPWATQRTQDSGRGNMGQEWSGVV